MEQGTYSTSLVETFETEGVFTDFIFDWALEQLTQLI